MILFVLLQAAIVINTCNFMIVDESLNQYGTFSVLLFGLYQIDQLNDLLESILSFLEFGDGYEQYLHECISSRCENQGEYQRNAQYIDEQEHVEAGIAK